MLQLVGHLVLLGVLLNARVVHRLDMAETRVATEAVLMLEAHGARVQALKVRNARVSSVHPSPVVAITVVHHIGVLDLLGVEGKVLVQLTAQVTVHQHSKRVRVARHLLDSTLAQVKVAVHMVATVMASIVPRTTLIALEEVGVADGVLALLTRGGVHAELGLAGHRGHCRICLVIRVAINVLVVAISDLQQTLPLLLILKVVKQLEEDLHRHKTVRASLMGGSHPPDAQLVGQSRKTSVKCKVVDEALDVQKAGEVQSYELIEIVAFPRQWLIEQNLEEVREVVVSVEANPSQIFV